MKTTAKYKDFSFNKKGDIELTLTIDRKYLQQVIELENTHDDKYFNVTTNKRVGQKTERQNNYCWSLMRLITEKEYGRVTEEGLMYLYANLIKMASIKVDYKVIPFYTEEETEIINKGIKDEFGKYEVLPTKTELQNVMEQYRFVRLLEVRNNEKQNSVALNCYKGISGFNKYEMNNFLETILDYASNIGIRNTYETEQLRSLIE